MKLLIFFNLEKFEASEYDEWGKDIPGVHYEEVKAKHFRGINRLEVKEEVDENLSTNKTQLKM